MHGDSENIMGSHMYDASEEEVVLHIIFSNWQKKHSYLGVFLVYQHSKQ